MTRLSDVHTAIVTGAGSGMGLELARRLAARGTKVVGVDRDPRALGDVAGVEAVVVDVTDDSAVREALEPLAGSCDLLVHAAGIGHSGGVLDTSLETYRRLVEVNYLGTVSVVGAVAPAMVARGRGHVALFASIAGWVPAPFHAPYNSTKAAVLMYADVLRLELARSGVRVTAICPPAVATPLLDDMPVSKQHAKGLVKPLTPEKVVEAVLRGIEADRRYVFPDLGSKAMSRMRRFTPRVLDAAITRVIS